MHEAAVFTATNGEKLTGQVDDEHPDCRDGEVVFVVDARAKRVADLPPGRLVVTVVHRTVRAMALVQRALRAGFDASLWCEVPPDARRDKGRR